MSEGEDAAMLPSSYSNNDHFQDELGEKCIYYAAVLGASMWASWITWMPFVHSLLPYLNSDPDARNDPTTLSHTFAEYNTIITIYIIGPVSLLFAFRVYRTVNQRDMSQVVRKCVLFVLLCVQYTTIVVIRHDTIQGLAHYIFTGLTFGLLLIYHGLIGSYPKYGEIWWAKWSLALVSILCMVVFAIGMLTSRKNIQDDNVLWTLLCLTEVVAVLSLGCLDIVDIYQLGKDMQKKR